MLACHYIYIYILSCNSTVDNLRLILITKSLLTAKNGECWEHFNPRKMLIFPGCCWFGHGRICWKWLGSCWFRTFGITLICFLINGNIMVSLFFFQIFRLYCHYICWHYLMFVIAPAHDLLNLLYLILQPVQVSPNNFQPWNPSPRDSLHRTDWRGHDRDNAIAHRQKLLLARFRTRMEKHVLIRSIIKRPVLLWGHLNMFKIV